MSDAKVKRDEREEVRHAVVNCVDETHRGLTQASPESPLRCKECAGVVELERGPWPASREEERLVRAMAGMLCEAGVLRVPCSCDQRTYISESRAASEARLVEAGLRAMGGGGE